MSINFKVNNFNLKYSDNFCQRMGGNNDSPSILIDTDNNYKYYALILEDINAAVNGSIVVHWYIPIIKLNNYKFNYKEGYNYYDILGYYGPCPPPNTGIHKYSFKLYALNNLFNPNYNELKIKNSFEFEKFLINNKISILAKNEIIFLYNTNY